MLRLALAFVLLSPLASAQSVELEAAGGAPLERVAFIAAPEADDLRVMIRAEGYDPFQTRTDSTADGRLAMVVPVHPDVLRGGTVAVIVYDGDREIETVGPFQIAAAPRADGAMARTMASIGASAGTTARAYGRTAGDLDGSLASLPIQLWGAASAASALQSQTGSPLDPGRTIHGEPVDLATADALAALFGFEAAAAAYAAQTAALGAPPDPVTTTPIVASGDPPTPARGPHAPEAPP
ncbi:MAG: hypothetical protein AAF594_17300, partial [Bacteroidota bacterium]